MKILQNKYFKIVSSILFTAFFVLAIIYFIDYEYFILSIKRVDIPLVIFGVVFLSINYLLRAWRYELILFRKEIRIFFSVTSMYYFFNKVLPARTGQISLPILLKKNLQIDYQKGVSAMLFAHLLDMSVMVTLLLVSMQFINVENLDLLNVISVVGLIFIFLSFIFLEKIVNLAIILFSKIKILRLQKWIEKLVEICNKIISYKQRNTNFFFIKIIAISFLSWLSIYLYYFFIVQAFSIKINFISTIFACSVSNFTFILPVNGIANLGPFEAGWVLGFMLIGISEQSSLPAGLFANLLATLITAILAFLGHIYLKKII